MFKTSPVVKMSLEHNVPSAHAESNQLSPGQLFIIFRILYASASVQFIRRPTGQERFKKKGVKMGEFIFVCDPHLNAA